MPIRLTGMNSGLDTEALVSELVSAYRKKTDKYVKAQTKLTWKQDAWKSLSAKTYSFRTSLDSMRMSSSYKLKTTSVSDSTKATVKAGNKAVNGSQSLNVVNLAKAGYLTGGKLKGSNGKSVTGSSTLDSLTYGSGAGTGSSVEGGKIKVNGREIELNDGMTISGVVSELQKAGVTASFDEKNQRIFISSKQSGAASDFTLAAMNDEGKEALKKLGIYAESETTEALYKQYAEIQEKFEKYCADNGITSPSAADRTTWLTDQLNRYNKDLDTITKANTAESYLAKGEAYAKTLEELSNIEQDLNTKFAGDADKINKAKELLGDSSKYVDEDGKVYTYKYDENGSYYLKDGDATTKYYLDTQTTGGTTKTVIRNAPVGQPATEEKTVSTADAYLDTMGVSKEQIQNYRNALSGKKAFEDAVQAEQTERLNTWTAELKAKALADFVDKEGRQPNTTEEQDIEQKAKSDAQAKLDAEKAYSGSDIEISSLTAVQAKYFKGGQNMDATEIAAAVKNVDIALNGDPADASVPDGIRTEREAAEKFVNDNAFMASYARKFAAATDQKTQAAELELMEKDLDYALKELGVGGTRASDYSEGAVRVNGQDATIYLNGAEYTSDSNTFNINGLTITALAATVSTDIADKLLNGKDDEKAAALAAMGSSAITITTATDNQGIYDKIKDFLGEYNNLINQMTASYNAESAKDYEPLTDEEREAMTESQIEKWEEKGKSAVLRRDGTLSALMSTLTSAMSQSFEINGKKYSLSTFGIKTLGILNAEKNEHNAYHIDGDEDDENVSGNADKLMAAITEDPDAVAEFFQLLTHNMSMELSKKMSNTQMRTYGTFYNDKEMAKEYSDYTTTIAKWEKKVADIEDSYYKKFAAMEKALASLQSQSSQLAGLLG